MSQTMTVTAPPQSQDTTSTSKMPFVFSIQAKNETVFKIKQVATGAHFVSLMLVAALYITEHDQLRNSLIFAGSMLILAIFLPPTGMLKPEDAPEYAHNTMQYMPKRDANGAIIAPEETKKESKKKGGKTKRSKKSN